MVPVGDGQKVLWGHHVALSGDGLSAVFSTAAAEVPADVNGHTDVYFRDLRDGAPPSCGW